MTEREIEEQFQAGLRDVERRMQKELDEEVQALSDPSGYASDFNLLRKACCDLMGGMEFNEIDGHFIVQCEDADKFERVVRTLPPHNK